MKKYKAVLLVVAYLAVGFLHEGFLASRKDFTMTSSMSFVMVAGWPLIDAFVLSRVFWSAVAPQ